METENYTERTRYSYGGVLGATFAALRPDLVKRMVLDGPVDAESYFNDILRWGRDSMRDSKKVGYTVFVVYKKFTENDMRSDSNWPFIPVSRGWTN